MTNSRILVTGAGGFIGHHLVKRLKAEGHWVRGVDQKLAEYEASDADEFEVLDLRMYESCLAATRGRSTKSTTWPQTWAGLAILPRILRISRATTS